MTLNFPNRLAWLIIGFIILVLLQSGCQPIQPAVDTLPTAASEESERANLSTNISKETTSPDGEWIATTLFQVPRGSDEYYQSLVVTHASGAPSYTLVEGTFSLGLGYTVAEPLMWSQDGARFYYTDRPQPDGCGLFANGSDLYQVDLATGETAELLPANTTWVLALAPDEKQIAYRTVGEATLTIHDLASGEIVPFNLAPILSQTQNESQDQMGAIVWSPDSSTLVFAVAHSPCMGDWAEATSLYTLDAETLALTPHLEQDNRLLIPVAWPSDQTLLLENQVPYDQLEQKGQFTIDLTTDVVTPVADQ